MKQTAVEFLFEMLKDNSKEVFDGNIWEQAKQMEKEQMNLSEIKGISNTLNYKNSLAEISDEEIEIGAINFCIKNIDQETMSRHDIFVETAKWYREQLKQRQ